jgi:hypothetical protein
MLLQPLSPASGLCDFIRRVYLQQAGEKKGEVEL